MNNYKDIYNMLIIETDGFSKDSGQLILKDKFSVDLTILILSNFYNVFNNGYSKINDEFEYVLLYEPKQNVIESLTEDLNRPCNQVYDITFNPELNEANKFYHENYPEIMQYLDKFNFKIELEAYDSVIKYVNNKYKIIPPMKYDTFSSNKWIFLDSSAVIRQGYTVQHVLDIIQILTPDWSINQLKHYIQNLDEDYNQNEFEIKDGVLIRYRGNSENVVIPDSVTSIGDSAFVYCNNLISITIPKSVTSIEQNAFSGCEKLTSITIPNSIKEIRGWTFQNCKSLSSVIISNSVTSIGRNAFNNCKNLESITIPNSVTSIEESTFFGCTNLTSITIPDSVTSIGDYAFFGCSGLSSITIPNSVTSIDLCAFSGCEKLTSITIPDSVTIIADCAFEECVNLEEVIFEKDYLYIKGTAFNRCPKLNLDEIYKHDITDSIQNVKNKIQNLDEDYNQNEFEIKDGVLIRYRGNSENVVIPNSVTSIGDDAFSDCESLISVIIPDSVTSIGSRAFWYCTSLTSITIPNSVTSIGSCVFYCCESLTSITIPNSITSIRRDTFYNCKSLTSIIIPNSVISIGHGAFDYCKSLTSITIPDSVISIGPWAFYNCEKLKEVIFENDFLHIYKSAFLQCPELNLDEIYKHDMDSNLENLKNKIQNLDEDYDQNKFEIKDGVLVRYNGNEQHVIIPNTITKIGNYAFEDCNNTTLITIPNSVTSIGKGAFISCKNLESVIISDSVTSIERSVFAYCHKLKEIKIPDSVTNIGVELFWDCTNLTSVIIGNSIKTLEKETFWNCNNLELVVLGNSIETICEHAFYNCYNLESITIPESVNTIQQQAFKNCNELQEVKFEGDYLNIDGEAFVNCYNLSFEEVIKHDIVCRIQRIENHIRTLKEGYENKTAIVVMSSDKQQDVDQTKGDVFYVYNKEPLNITNKNIIIEKNPFKIIHDLYYKGYNNIIYYAGDEKTNKVNIFEIYKDNKSNKIISPKPFDFTLDSLIYYSNNN